MDKIEHTLAENQELLKFIGERITASDRYTLDSINSLLKGTNVLALSHLMGAYISWADKSGTILVSGKKGILEVDKPSISHRRYYKEGLKEAWKLHISPVEQSVFSTNYVLPTSISVADSRGEVIGFLVLGLRLKFLERVIDEELKGLEWNAAYFTNDLIVGSVGFPKSFAWANTSYANGGSFVVKSGKQFALKVAVGLTMLEIFIRCLKMYFVFILIYYVIAYFILKYGMPAIKRYGAETRPNASVNLELALSSGDKIDNLKSLLLHSEGTTKDMIEFLISMLEKDRELSNKVVTIQGMYDQLTDAMRVQNKHIAKIGVIAQYYFDQLQADISALYEKGTNEEKILLSKVLNDIEQIVSGDLSKNEQSYCNVVEYIKQALAINAYNIQAKELLIESVFDEHPELYIDGTRLESAIISVIRYCIDSSLKGKVLAIKTKNIISNNSSKIQITFSVNMVAMNRMDKLALEQLLDISTRYNIFDPLSKTYEQIEKSFEFLEATIKSSEYGGMGMKITVMLNISSSHNGRSNITSSQDNILVFRKTQ